MVWSGLVWSGGGFLPSATTDLVAIVWFAIRWGHRIPHYYVHSSLHRLPAFKYREASRAESRCALTYRTCFAILRILIPSSPPLPRRCVSVLDHLSTLLSPPTPYSPPPLHPLSPPSVLVVIIIPRPSSTPSSYHHPQGTLGTCSFSQPWLVVELSPPGSASMSLVPGRPAWRDNRNTDDRRQKPETGRVSHSAVTGPSGHGSCHLACCLVAWWPCGLVAWMPRCFRV